MSNPDWSRWLTEDLALYRALTEAEQGLLQQHIARVLSEISIRGPVPMTERLKVLVAGQACLLLLGGCAESFEGLQKLVLRRAPLASGHKSEWREGKLLVDWPEASADIEVANNGLNTVLYRFAELLVGKLDAARTKALHRCYGDYLLRANRDTLFWWEYRDTRSHEDLLACNVPVFFEQPYELKRDLPALYALYQDWLGVDPLGWIHRRREQVAARRFPTSWRRMLLQRVALYRRLPDELKHRLEGLILVFCDQIKLVARGFDSAEVSDWMRLCVAADACLLLLGRSFDDFRHLARVEIMRGNPEGRGNVGGDSTRSRIRLNWFAAEHGTRAGSKNYNIIIHEFAHLLDWADDDTADSIPFAADEQQRRRWTTFLEQQYDELVRRYRSGQGHVVDQYAAEWDAGARAEFFPCASESFFEQSSELKQNHPVIYYALEAFYQLDPAAWG